MSKPDHRAPKLWRKDVRLAQQTSVNLVQPFAVFTSRILFTWKNSVWKVMLPELLVWLLLFGTVSIIYRYAPEKMQDSMSLFFHYCRNFESLVPLSFILGFYVTQIFSRWWSQWQSIPWIGKLAIVIHDLDDRPTKEGLLVRWTYMRWMLLGMGITFHSISSSFRKLYPDLQSFAKCGITNQKEIEILNRVESKTEICFEWLGELLRKQQKNNPEHCGDRSSMKILRENLIAWRTSLAILRGFNNHPVPLAYAQVISFVVYTYFFAAIFGRQFFVTKDIVPSSTPTFKDGTPIDIYFPLFSVFEFMFFISWFKLACMMQDPFSETACEHVLQRVWDEEVSWARQGSQFVMDGNYPEFDPNLTPDKTLIDELFESPPEEIDPPAPASRSQARGNTASRHREEGLNQPLLQGDVPDDEL